MKKKDEGASIILALLYLLVCSVLCIVIISASTVSVGKASEMKYIDTSKYITISTLKLFANEVSEKVIEYHYEGTMFFERNLETSGIESIAKVLPEMIVEILDGGEESERDLELSLNNDEYLVKAKLMIDDDYMLAINVYDVIVNNEHLVLPTNHLIKFYPLEVRNNNSSLWIRYGNGEME